MVKKLKTFLKSHATYGNETWCTHGSWMKGWARAADTTDCRRCIGAVRLPEAVLSRADGGIETGKFKPGSCVIRTATKELNGADRGHPVHRSVRPVSRTSPMNWAVGQVELEAGAQDNKRNHGCRRRR